jgi:hypothetical protein
MSNLRYSESIVVARSAEFLYDMVSDVTRMGEWSPVCKACWWDDGGGIAMFQQRFGEGARAQIANRTDAAHKGIPVTLAAIKKIAESQ